VGGFDSHTPPPSSREPSGTVCPAGLLFLTEEFDAGWQEAVLDVRNLLIQRLAGLGGRLSPHR